MEPHTFFLSLLIILLGARIFGEFAVRLGMPSVIGEILAGILLGPSLLGWVEPDKVIQLLAEIGIILLLFDVGLETDARRLVDAGSRHSLSPYRALLCRWFWGFWSVITCLVCP